MSFHCAVFSLQATIRGKRQPPWLCREAEHWEEASEHEQWGAPVAPPDQSPHVPRLLPTAPLLLHLPCPLIPVLFLLTCSRVRLPHPLSRLSQASSVLLPFPQSRHQSKPLPGTSHTHSQGSEQSKLLPWPGHAHTQRVGQPLQLSCKISSRLSPLSFPLSSSFLSECEWSFSTCWTKRQNVIPSLYWLNWTGSVNLSGIDVIHKEHV